MYRYMNTKEDYLISAAAAAAAAAASSALGIRLKIK